MSKFGKRSIIGGGNNNTPSKGACLLVSLQACKYHAKAFCSKSKSYQSNWNTYHMQNLTPGDCM